MTPRQLLEHDDQGRLWPAEAQGGALATPQAAYAGSLAVRALRIARGEVPLGFKVGFTNRTIWPRYQVFAPMWGTVWNTTVATADDEGTLSLAHTCQPRIEPEAVFGFKTTPPQGATLDDLFASLDWLAPGFEVVQSHRPDWKFTATETMAANGLHARLLVGRRRPVGELAATAAELDRALAAARVSLFHEDRLVEQGLGANVLDSPLRALLHFVTELRGCPGAPDIAPGDLVTTGTWTDAWPVLSGQRWSARFDAPLQPLAVRF